MNQDKRKCFLFIFITVRCHIFLNEANYKVKNIYTNLWKLFVSYTTLFRPANHELLCPTGMRSGKSPSRARKSTRTNTRTGETRKRLSLSSLSMLFVCALKLKVTEYQLARTQTSLFSHWELATTKRFLQSLPMNRFLDTTCHVFMSFSACITSLVRDGGRRQPWVWIFYRTIFTAVQISPAMLFVVSWRSRALPN